MAQENLIKPLDHHLVSVICILPSKWHGRSRTCPNLTVRAKSLVWFLAECKKNYSRFKGHKCLNTVPNPGYYKCGKPHELRSISVLLVFEYAIRCTYCTLSFYQTRNFGLANLVSMCEVCSADVHQSVNSVLITCAGLDSAPVTLHVWVKTRYGFLSIFLVRPWLLYWNVSECTADLSPCKLQTRHTSRAFVPICATFFSVIVCSGVNQPVSNFHPLASPLWTVVTNVIIHSSAAEQGLQLQGFLYHSWG